MFSPHPPPDAPSPDVGAAPRVQHRGGPHRVVLVSNAAAGGCLGDDAPGALRDRLGDIVELVEFDPDGGVEGLTAALTERLAPGVDRVGERLEGCVVAACGGDGTVAATATAIHALRPTGAPAMAVLPGGTANLLARELGIPEDLEGAVEVLASGRPRRLDAMIHEGGLALCRVALGDFARSGQRADSKAKQTFGALAYLASGLPELTSPLVRPFHVSIDGVARTIEASSLVLTNVGTIGLGPLSWGEHVDPGDGHLELVAMRPGTPRETARLVAHAADTHRRDEGGVLDAPAAKQEITHWIVRDRVTFSRLDDVPVVVDGELSRAPELELGVLPEAIEVIAPAP